MGSMARRRFASVVAAVTIATLMSACGRDAPSEPQTVGNTVGVATAVATSETLRDVIVAEGQVVPAADADFSVVAPEPALVAQLPKALGDAVAVGDVLARFDIPSVTEQITTRERELSEATIRLQSAKTEADRQQSLFDRGLVPRNQAEASRAAVAPAEAALAEAKKQMDAARQIQDRTIVKARFAGVVARQFHQVGDFVAGANDPVLRVVDPARIEVAILIPAAQAVRIAPGLPANIQAAGVLEPIAASVAPQPLSSQPGSSSTEVRLAFAAKPTLAVDTQVRAEIVFAERPDAIVVPTIAVQRDETTSFVMIAGPDSVARRRTVRVGLIAAERTEIVEGVSPGERVITKPLDQVADGVAITIER
jgi:membrane fusion protein (multidrug efflux system)